MQWSMSRGPVLLMVMIAFGWSAQAANRPVIQISRAGSGVEVSWTPAGDGYQYTVETAPRLGPADWRPATSPDPWPVFETRWTGALSGQGNAFFRVVARPTGPRGTIETNVLLQAFSRSELEGRLAALGLPVVIQNGVEAWKVIYATVDPHGRPFRASALVAVPVGVGGALPLASYQHGTVTHRDDVPSRLNEEGTVGLVLAGTGYLAVLPDYLGLGDSPGVHPYHHATSAASAVVDALRAARELFAARDVAWNGQVFLIGYSQGGHATLAAQREIEQAHQAEWTLTASAPGAGAYDLSGITADYFVSEAEQPSPYYFPYLLASFVEVYGIAPSLGDLLRPPYDTVLPPLLDGHHGGGEIDAVMPARPVEILKPEVLQAFLEDPNHPLRAALRENDLYRDWVPQTPTRFYHCRGDRDVPFANSQLAVDTFKTAGAPSVTLIDPFPAADHGSCAYLALLGGKLWFDTLRR